MPNPVADMVRLLGTTTSPVIFDVGAHHGYVSNEFREALPDALIHAFEPFPES